MTAGRSVRGVAAAVTSALGSTALALFLGGAGRRRR
jgi:hypothetical protein